MFGRMSRFLRVALIVLLSALLVGTSAFADSIPVKLNTAARIYRSANTDSHSIKAPKNLKVTLKAYANGWGKITYKGHTGFVKLKYLDRINPVKAFVKENATVYKDAGGDDKLGSAPAGSTVYVIGVDGSYLRIMNKSGTKRGYIKASAISATRRDGDESDDGASSADAVPESLRSTTKSAGDSKIEYAIYLAQNLIGAPYDADANPPKTFDCAKFCCYCYGKAQSNALKGSSYAQGYDDSYRKIAYGDLKRGDLVCFDTVEDDDASDHTGIYIGGGYFIHASSAAKKVILSQLNSGYYKRTFSWGRRIFEK